MWPSFPTFFLDDHRTGLASSDQSPALLEGSGMQRRHRPAEKPVQCSEQNREQQGQMEMGRTSRTGSQEVTESGERNLSALVMCPTN